jgi:hypothetical protein
MTVACEGDEQAPWGDLPLSLPAFVNRPGNSTLLGTKRHPDLRLETSVAAEAVAQYQSFSPDCNASSRGLSGALHGLPSNRSRSTDPRPQMFWTEACQGFHSLIDTSPFPSLLPVNSTPLLTDTSGSGSKPSPRLAAFVPRPWFHPTMNTVSCFAMDSSMPIISVVPPVEESNHGLFHTGCEEPR